MLSSAVVRRSRPSFFFNDPATTEIYTLSLHDALPIFVGELVLLQSMIDRQAVSYFLHTPEVAPERSEEHTSELQSPYDLVCRLLLEKKKQNPDLLEDRPRGEAGAPPAEDSQPALAGFH